jgi:hypothetical protein
VNVIEVIGHTDEQPIVRRPSNLDQTLKSVLQDSTPIIRLTPADNAGLGLARAVSVAKVLQADNRLAPFSILPYSGAQLVDVNDTVSITGIGADVRERRRIEIRLRKSDKIVILPPGALATSIPKNRPMAPPIPGPSPAEHIVPQAEAFPEAEMQVEPDAQPPQPAPPPRQFRPFRWMFRN